MPLQEVWNFNISFKKYTSQLDLLRVPSFKGLVHPKIKIRSVFTHPYVVPTP